MSLQRTNISGCPSAHPAACLRNVALLLAIVASAAGMSGCRQGVYSPRTLPPKYAARPVIDVQSLDLGRMAGRATRSEIIYPGDTLEVLTATGSEEKTPDAWQLRVVENGTVDVPLVGPVPVAGTNLVQAEHVIRDACRRRRVYRDPNVRVKISKRQVERITVTGAVEKPDTYELPVAGSNLAAALIAAGGLSEKADRMVEIRQPRESSQRARETVVQRTSYEQELPVDGEREVIHVDLATAVSAGGEELQLRDGAVITVRPRPDRYVHVIGIISNQTIELPRNRNVTLLEAISKAGGPRYSPWISDKVKVTRYVPGSDETITINASIAEAKRRGEANIQLAAGDVISVEENLITFTLSTLGSLVGIGTSAATGAAVGL